jgi:hypothetical protein
LSGGDAVTPQHLRPASAICPISRRRPGCPLELQRSDRQLEHRAAERDRSDETTSRSRFSVGARRCPRRAESQSCAGRLRCRPGARADLHHDAAETVREGDLRDMDLPAPPQPL